MSALSTFEEAAGSRLLPYIPELVETFQQCFSLYQQKNLILLLDTIGTLAAAIEEDFGHDTVLTALLPPIIEYWNSLNNDDRRLMPVIECFGLIARSITTKFRDCAPHVFSRCLNIMQTSLVELSVSHTTP